MKTVIRHVNTQLEDIDAKDLLVGDVFIDHYSLCRTVVLVGPINLVSQNDDGVFIAHSLTEAGAQIKKPVSIAFEHVPEKGLFLLKDDGQLWQKEGQLSAFLFGSEVESNFQAEDPVYLVEVVYV